MYRLYNTGHKTDPCATPAAADQRLDIESPTGTENALAKGNVERSSTSDKLILFTINLQILE